MDWITVTVRTTTEGADIVSGLMIEAGSSGTMIEDRHDIALNQRPEGQWDIIDPAIAERMSEDVLVVGYYESGDGAEASLKQVRGAIEELKALDIGIDFGKLELAVDGLCDEDWAESWKLQFKPIRLGSHIVICPSWSKVQLEPGDKLIQLDPGMAFGTGSHETTCMCVELIEKYVRAGDRVIDLGTGSGILAIAAAHLGAEDVLATDIDPVATRVAAENAAINGASNVVRVRAGDLLECVDEVCDLLVANIISDVIISVAAPVKNNIKPGGIFICSGIAVERKPAVLRALEAAGYDMLEVREKGEWVAIASRR